jgi:hypothetical protein
MKRFIAQVLSLVLLSLCAVAQQPNASTNNQPKIAEREQNACTGDHKPGDHLKCYVVFDGDPELQSVTLYFRLQGSAQENQIGLSGEYSLGQWRKIGPGEYSVEGQVSDCAKGNYQLAYLNVSMRGVGRNYWYGPDFKDLLKVVVLNDVDLHFPKIKDVSAEAPKEEKAAAIPVKK